MARLTKRESPGSSAIAGALGAVGTVAGTVVRTGIEVAKRLASANVHQVDDTRPSPAPPSTAAIPPGTVVLDVETRRSADEVGGWDNIMQMGVSVAIVWDYRTAKFHAYREESIKALVDHVYAADLIVGFNQLRFDLQVLAGYETGGKKKKLYSALQSRPNIDLLVLITDKLGHRVKLESVSRATLGIEKTGDGLQALKWFKQGKFDRIERYCTQDVDITRRLFEHAITAGQLKYEDHGTIREVPLDVRRHLPKVQA